MFIFSKQICHLDRSEAEWRDLRFVSPSIFLPTD
jgi:hypothetical protein